MFSIFMVPCFSMCELLVSEMIMIMVLLSSPYIFFSWNMPYMMCLSLFFDKLSLYLGLMTFWICSLMIYTLSNYNYSSFKKKGGIFLTCMLSLTLILMFYSVSFINFFMLFEFSMIPTMLLILGWGYQPERLEAFFNFFYFTSIPSMPLLTYIMFYSDFSMIMIYMNDVNWLNIMFYLIFSVFLVKIPLYFSHFWLPKAHVEAPVAGSMILAGILLKMGGYGLIRFINFIKFNISNYFVMSISSLGMVMSCVMCFLSPDLKMVIAYSSVSHMNFMITGLLVNKNLVMFSSLLMMLSHALSSSGMFYLCDVLYKRSHSRSILLNKSSIIVCPMISFWWMIFCIINMAFPFTPGNLSEMFLGMMLLKTLSFIMCLILMAYFFLSAYYSIFIYYSINHGFSESENLFWPLDLKENLTMLSHCLPCVILSFMSFTMMM
uniref:NADH-ubiquinone oxidoreductase chain 4 n=1 Tax=Osborniella crotophagae TaxID=1912107 RepID=A0A7T1HF06_9NEOP|nr:NADH dehydrogenase subunit 4 [Osborniella crotophagae]